MLISFLPFSFYYKLKKHLFNGLHTYIYRNVYIMYRAQEELTANAGSTPEDNTN